ncbi:hypothetical protein TBLA_0A01730 [Henningerozyma blattae CBS 6284]|uniref:Sodium/calcium exchanger membrane region domain-containing protein n=1 Tax=Henningerozyma blattae (strain ATCC 34711 / CBS 6284 / DSM 70876 / NBRC 10599 / NRRL Y-10934 / UCD 77-7) TaxID=1071380 RepID=I2GV21_HENB6|nr:hypothetical protein TBLA_0A01730 [Tetrapisispora blattae CBS 6284]CCH57973.1 hypothetical protein TBLA_0A01730 [Tetrapisispora blattae CBS 6284]
MTKLSRWILVVSCYLVTLILFYFSFQYKWLEQYIIEPMKLLLCFAALGIITSNFLTPSLSYISIEIFHISDKVAGMTLLALGNGIPDITSTYKAMNSGAVSLAIGQLIGGVFFLCTVVFGMMGLVRTIELKPTEWLKENEGVEEAIESSSSNFNSGHNNDVLLYSREYFISDILAFLLVLILPLYFLSDGHLRLYECIIMVLEYCLFMIYILWRNRKQTTIESEEESETFQRTISTTGEDFGLEAIISNNRNQDDLSLLNLATFNNGIIQRRKQIRQRIRHYFRYKYNGWFKISLRDCLDVWENQKIFDSSQNNDIITSTSNLETNNTNIPDNHLTPTNILDENRPLIPKRKNTISSLGDEPLPNFIISQPSDENLDSIKIRNNRKHSLNTIHNTAKDNTKNFDDDIIGPYYNNNNKTKSLSCDHLPDISTGYQSLPRSRSNSVNNQRSSMIYDPFDNVAEESVALYTMDNHWLSKWRIYQLLHHEDSFSSKFDIATIIFTTPIVILLTLLIPQPMQEEIPTNFKLHQTLQISIAPCIIEYLHSYSISFTTIMMTLIILLMLFAIHLTNFIIVLQYKTSIQSFCGFILSLFTISYCVEIVVDTLTNWTDQYNFSETILGLTIFAWGNSIGDLVSNVTFFKIGILDVAIGACLGSPLLYFVFGIGIDGILLILGNFSNNIQSTGNISKSIFYKSIDFKFDSHLILCSIGFILACLILLIAIPLNNWKIDKKTSYLLLSLYILILGANIYLDQEK